MAEALKKQELATLCRELSVKQTVFYVTTSHTRHMSGPDILIPLNNIAVWLRKENCRGLGPSKRQAAQQQALRDAGWIVLLPYGAHDALHQIESVLR
jgi:hypothetical protein